MRVGLRLQLLFALAALCALAFAPLYLAVAGLTRATLVGERRVAAAALAHQLAARGLEHAALAEGRRDAFFAALAADTPDLVSIELRAPDGRELGFAGTRTDESEATLVRSVASGPGGSALVALRAAPATPAPLVGLVGLYTAAFAASLLLFAYFAVTRLVVGPIDALTHAARRVAAGARGLEAPTSGPVELVELGASLAQMTAAMRRDEEALRVQLRALEETTARLASAQAQLLRAERLASVGRLAAGLAHEVGNPLAALLGFEDLLLEGGLEPSEVHDFLRRMRDETERIHRIVRDLLAFARPDRSAATAADAGPPGEVDVAVERVVNLLKPQRDLRSLSLTIDLATGLPPVALSTERLVQTLLNLLLNAADAAAPAGKVVVRARLESPGSVSVEVEDDGPGIDPSVAGMLFEPFVSTKDVGRGTGLGLAVCRGLVEGAGGTIIALPPRDRGALFRVTLPVASVTLLKGRHPYSVYVTRARTRVAASVPRAERAPAPSRRHTLMIRKVRWLSCAATSFALLIGAASCGGAHDAMRPDQPTAAGATGRVSVKPVEGPSSPLIVDWKAEQRGDLEEVVHDGVAVVAWDDQGLRLLKRCKAGGDYGYLALQTKKEAVHLETADEVQATLPLGGLGIAGKIGGGFDQGTTLDIATEIVGKRRTTSHDIAMSELKGDCQGATHYIRALDVGAFVMKTGSKANAQAAVQILGFGSSGGTSSSKDVSSSDGSADACEKATGEESRPVSQCGALLRVELEPLAKGSAGPPASDSAATTFKPRAVEGCPPGFVPVNGGCKRQSTNIAHVCSPDSPDECTAQCSKGDVQSCDLLGSLIASGARGPRDLNAARSAFGKACEGGNGNGCAHFGMTLWDGTPPGAMQLSKDPSSAQRVMNAFVSGCRMGSALACAQAGHALIYGITGRRDDMGALRFSTKACEGGDFTGCADAGIALTGNGPMRDPARAALYSKRACYGGKPGGCSNAATAYERGDGVQRNPALAAALRQRGCRLMPSSSDCRQ